MEGSKLRVVLLGKTGTGKSSLCNTLFGDNVFETDDSANCGMKMYEAKTRDADGRSLTLIDTPGFFGTDTSEKQHKYEIMKCITECAPGPHAFLILLKVERFTPQEKKLIEKILQTFSEEVFKYAIIVFTHGDQLPVGMKIEKFVQRIEGLRDLVNRCGGRCHVFDNRYWNQQDEYRSNQFQRGELLTTIERMVGENGGGCYTNDMLQQVETVIQRTERRMHQSVQAIQTSLEEIREQAKAKVYHTLRMCAGVSTGVLLGALLGVPFISGMAFSSFRKSAENMKPVLAAAAKKVAEGAESGGPAAPGLAEVVVRARSKATEGIMAGPFTGSAASKWSHHPIILMAFPLPRGTAENMKPVLAAVAKKVAQGAESGEPAAPLVEFVVRAWSEATAEVTLRPAGGSTAAAAAAAGGGAEGTILTTLAAAAGVAAVGGAAAGGCVGYTEAQKTSTIMEAAENTASKVWNMTNKSFQL